jgi:hypothetical protein
MYLRRHVLSKLDGLGEPVCHYAQKDGICKGVSLEWLRRVMVKNKEELEPSYYGLGHEQRAAVKSKMANREARWGKTQNDFYGSAKHAFHAALLDTSDPSISKTSRAALDELDDVRATLEDALKRPPPGGQYRVSATTMNHAKRMLRLQGTPVGLTPMQAQSVHDMAIQEHSAKQDALYDEWHDTTPMEMSVFKERSKDVIELTTDDKGMELRARFSGMKVVEAANTLTVNTERAYEAMLMAVRDPQLTPGRGLLVAVKAKTGPGHAHAVYYSQTHPSRFLWIDPNYGVWRMERVNVVRAMIYLYDHTDVKGEKGIYQLGNTPLNPRGFEYSVWARAS